VCAVAGKIPPAPFVKGGAQRTGDLSPPIMCTNLLWSDLEPALARASSPIWRIATGAARKKSQAMGSPTDEHGSSPFQKHRVGFPSPDTGDIPKVVEHNLRLASRIDGAVIGVRLRELSR
jgi:hypothetical protein